MKLTFKDLKQQKFVIDAEPSETVGQVKEKISSEKGWEAPQLKLIYSGKILQDDKTIESYNIEEKGFVVCMVSKPKTQPSSQGPSTPSKPVASTPAAPPAPAPSANTSTSAAPVPATPSPVSSGATQQAASFNDPSALLSGSQSQEAISQMENMGFERADINRAMRAAFFNPDRAIEYLLSGIPENIQQEQEQRSAAAAGTGPQAPAAPATGTAPAASGEDEPVNLFEAAAQAGNTEGRGAARGASGGESQANLDFLRNNPHFQQLRQLVQQQPQMLEPILQQVGAGNPQIAQLIGQNEEQFLQLLSEDPEEGALPPGTTQIHVTEEERDAIERLCLLGFSRDMVIQAYFACDKNEELAANYLFENSDEGEDA
ncbi:XPC-binding domain-containing protein [Aspergillus unguis]